MANIFDTLGRAGQKSLDFFTGSLRQRRQEERASRAKAIQDKANLDFKERQARIKNIIDAGSKFDEFGLPFIESAGESLGVKADTEGTLQRRREGGFFDPKELAELKKIEQQTATSKAEEIVKTVNAQKLRQQVNLGKQEFEQNRIFFPIQLKRAEKQVEKIQQELGTNISFKTMQAFNSFGSGIRDELGQLRARKKQVDDSIVELSGSDAAFLENSPIPAQIEALQKQSDQYAQQIASLRSNLFDAFNAVKIAAKGIGIDMVSQFKINGADEADAKKQALNSLRKRVKEGSITKEQALQIGREEGLFSDQ
jgi:hypothetical protein